MNINLPIISTTTSSTTVWTTTTTFLKGIASFWHSKAASYLSSHYPQHTTPSTPQQSQTLHQHHNNHKPSQNHHTPNPTTTFLSGISSFWHTNAASCSSRSPKQSPPSSLRSQFLMNTPVTSIPKILVRLMLFILYYHLIKCCGGMRDAYYFI